MNPTAANPNLRAPALPAANRILIIDDNETIHADFRKILGPAATSDEPLRQSESLLFGAPADATPVAPPVYHIDSATQGETGLRLVEAALSEGRPYALAFIDVRMPPGWDGIETAGRIWQVSPELPVVICTAYSDYSWSEMMSRLGHPDNLVVLRKPFEPVEVLQLVHSLTHKWLLARKVRAHIEELEGLVQLRTRDLQETNDALRISEERFANAFRHNPVPLLLADAVDGLGVDVNDSWVGMTGFDREAIRRQAPDGLNPLIKPEVWRELLQRLGAGMTVRNRQTEILTAGGNTLTVLISAEPLQLQDRPHLLLSLQDITERLNIENQLRQAQKMEAVGQIAAGVAHDFNNILAVIQGHTELQLNIGHPDESLADSLREISTAADRAASLTRQLLAFSRKQMLRPRSLDLEEVLGRVGKMLQRIIGEQIQLHIRCAANLPPILADQVNLEQIIINLSVNARDAMPKGGPLTITAELAQVDARHKDQQSDALAGTFVKLSVADKGVGMDPAVRRKLFEPFFTTKAVGKGTGMGLATVYGIVKQHGGWIEVQSEPGAGSTFMVFLPVANGEPKPPVKTGTDFLRAPAPQQRTLLVVEDEPPLREMAAKILRRLGYEVFTARDGPEALQLWSQHRDKIDLLFSDMTMPGGISGRELAARLVHDKPALHVVYSTGYTVDFTNPEVKLQEGGNLLLKPYDASALVRIVRKALAG